ncbi:MAG: HAD-IA family hydrolase [Planctomycetes bacterium]|nr:HAD-IA family hydrolase [Planctomycetota bacterium]
MRSNRVYQDHTRDATATSTQTTYDNSRRLSGAVQLINDVNDPESCFVELFDHFAGPSAWKCFPEVDEVLKTLHRAGYRLAVASNFDSRLDALCDGLPELGPIELRVISSQVGYRKPSLHFYRALAAAADCQPAEILMVGNDFQNDILGAQQAGLQTHFVQRN